MLANGYKHHTVPDAMLHQYGGSDADATCRLYHVLRGRMWQQHADYCAEHGLDPYRAIGAPDPGRAYAPTVWNLYHGIIIPVSAAIAEMENTGMAVDMARMLPLIEAFDLAAKDIEGSLRAMIHDPTFNLRSPKQVAELLFGAPGSADEHGVVKTRLGLTPIKSTSKPPKMWHKALKDGEVEYDPAVGWKSDFHSPSTDAESLAILADEQGCQEASVVRDYRFVDQIRKSFLPTAVMDRLGHMVYEGGLPSMVHEDGRVRTTLSQLTDTGRWRSSKPNMQNLPKGREGDLARVFGDKKVPSVRSVFQAEDGWVFIEGDFKSAESYTLAFIADDPALKADLEARDPDTGEELSVHSVTAVNVFKLDMTVPEFERARKTDKRLAGLRVAAKSVNFGIPYGRSGGAIARQVQREGVECTEDDGRRWVEEWYDRYVKCAEFIRFCHSSVYDPGYLVTPFGRVRHFHTVDDESIMAAQQREASNYPLQSTVADALSRALVLLRHLRDKYRLRFRVVLAIHDAILLEVPYEETAVAEELLQHCMSALVEVPGTGLHYGVDIEMSERWCEHMSPELEAKIAQVTASLL